MAGTEGKKVCLSFNNENGEWVWAIQDYENLENWLDACADYDEALRYCDSMKWIVMGASSAGGWTPEDEWDTFSEPRCPYCGTFNKKEKGAIACRACSRVFCSFEIPAGVVYCTRK
jgi:hypothetical protein